MIPKGSMHGMRSTLESKPMRMEQVPYIDATGANALATFTRQAKHSGTEVWLVGLQEQPREFLARFEPRFAGARRAASWAAGLRRLKQAQ